jgi:antitoxin YefM
MDISYSQLRQNLKSTIDSITDLHEPFFVTSHNQKKAVILSYEDYLSLEETAYLLKSPKMAQRLLQAVLEVNSGKTENHPLIEDGSDNNLTSHLTD